MPVRLLVAPLLVSLLASSSPAQEVEQHPNLTYRTVGDRALQVDLAKPAGDGPFPAIVFVHGGGWRRGNRARYRTEIVEAAKRGYVAITVTYRLTEPKDGKATNPFPVAVHDVKAAVRWLRANAEKYGVDPKRVGATGGSAGGHLSLMLGTTDAKDDLEGDGGYADRTSRVQAVVNVFGPTEMPALGKASGGAAPILVSFLGGTNADKPAVWKQASPVTFVTKDDPPTLTIHGADDRLVPVEQAHLLDKAMKAVGVTHELLVLEGQGHGFRGDANEKARKAMYAFFDEHLKKAD